MVLVKVNVIDSQVNLILKTVEKSGMCNLVHKSDNKVYVRNPKSKRFYAMNEEQLTFHLDSKCIDFEKKLSDFISIIENATTDKFLELIIDTKIESEEVEKILKGTLSEPEFEELCTDAIQVRWK